MAKKNNRPQLPAIDGKPKQNRYYVTVNTVDKSTGKIRPKEAARQRFISRFGSAPRRVFYGPPRGSLIYAGPAPFRPHSLGLAVPGEAAAAAELEQMELGI